MSQKLKTFTFRKISTGGILIIQATSLKALRKRLPEDTWALETPEPESETKPSGNNNEATGP